MMRSVRDELARVVGFREDRRRAHPTRDLIRRPHATQDHDPWRPLRPAPVLRGELIAAHARAEIRVENDHICRDRRQSIWVVVHDQHMGLVLHGFAKSNDPPRAFVATYFRIGTARRLTASDRASSSCSPPRLDPDLRSGDPPWNRSAETSGRRPASSHSQLDSGTSRRLGEDLRQIEGVATAEHVKGRAALTWFSVAPYRSHELDDPRSRFRLGHTEATP